MFDTGTPSDNLRSPAVSKHSMASVTKVVKGHDGKTYVQNVADVEDDVLPEENDEYVISDDEIDKEMRSMSNSNLDVTRLSISSNLSMRNVRTNSNRK